MLSREQLEDSKKCFKIGDCSKCKLYNPNFTGTSVPCVELISQTALELLDKAEAQEKEIEQLKAQNAAYREAFLRVQHDIDSAECRDDLDGIKGYIDEALLNQPIEYHNPADVEALKQAKEALSYTYGYSPLAREAIEAIDEVIGGGKDGH